MQFPIQDLKPNRAEIRGLIFENAPVGVRLGLYWSLFLEFEPFQYAGHELGCNLSADWIRLPVRDWRHLEGQLVEGGPEVIECSFYTLEHDTATRTHVRIGGRRGRSFDLQWDVVVAFGGVAEEDADDALTVRARTVAEFAGVQIHQSVVSAVESERGRATELLSRFVDVARFGTMEIWTNEFGTTSWWLRPGA
jgi:hypothetical protein